MIEIIIAAEEEPSRCLSSCWFLFMCRKDSVKKKRYSNTTETA
jgi:hypothetical protein